MVARARVEGFLVLDQADRFDMARRRLARWVADGRLRHREDILDGLAWAGLAVTPAPAMYMTARLP